MSTTDELEILYPPIVVVDVMTKKREKVSIEIPELSLKEYTRFKGHMAGALDGLEMSTLSAAQFVDTVMAHQDKLGAALGQLFDMQPEFFTEEIGLGKLANVVGVLAKVNIDFFDVGVVPLLEAATTIFVKLGAGLTPSHISNATASPTPVRSHFANSTATFVPPIAPSTSRDGTESKSIESPDTLTTTS